MARKPVEKSNNSLLTRLLDSNAKGIEDAILAESEFYNRGDESIITTPLPAFNIALSGDIKGGLAPGISIFAGASSTGKTLLSWVAAKSFQKKFPDGVIIFYDVEFGSSLGMLESMGIDMTRVIHIPLYNVEELKFDLMKRLETITLSDKVFILVDSLGLLASKKEVEDAENEKSVADMSRAKAIKSMFRILLPLIASKGVYSIFINHTYDTQGLFATKVLGGGEAVRLSANFVTIFSKSQEKDGTELAGFNIHLTSMKSRYIREKSRLSMLLNFEGGFDQFTGIVDLAIESGLIVNSSKGYYQLVDHETGELLYDAKKFRLKEIENAQYLVPIMRSDKFKQYVRETYKLSNEGKSTINEEFDIDSI